MSDWQPGDLALCVEAGDVSRPGQVFTVYAVREGGLRFEELRCYYTAVWVWSTSCRFRKIRPHIPDAEDRETIRLLTGKPVREDA